MGLMTLALQDRVIRASPTQKRPLLERIWFGSGRGAGHRAAALNPCDGTAKARACLLIFMMHSSSTAGAAVHRMLSWLSDFFSCRFVGRASVSARVLVSCGAPRSSWAI